MKKRYVCIVLMLFLSAGAAKAQSIEQLTVQLYLDVQKLSELKSILNDMYQSYKILDQGYTDIKNIAEGNFNLHQAFLDALLAISPTVRNYARIAEIISAEATIVREYKEAYSRFKADGHFTISELDYIGKLYSTIFNQSLKSIDELTMVVTANQLRMSDAERLAAIDRVYGDITGDLLFLRRFNNSTSVQAIQRARAAGDISTLQKIYGITQ
jgi:hypothetical protein